MGTPLGFMVFLGIVSLIGVIISHVIVLFDFIEEMHEDGEGRASLNVTAGAPKRRSSPATVVLYEPQKLREK